MAYPALLLFALSLAGEPGGPSAAAELPRITDTLPCRGAGDEVVVCGRRSTVERYRIPVELRQEPLTSRNYSWAARARDEREAARYEDQVTGSSGAFNRSRQTDCQWRAERQQLTGRLIDCAQDIPFELRN